MRHTRWAVFGILLLLSAQAGFAADTGDPSEVRLKIEAMWLSANADCTEASLVYDETPAVYRDMTQNPTFGSASVPNGTYRCLVFRMSDRIEGRSAYDSTTGNCTNGQQLVLDIFRSGSSTCPDGSTVPGTSGEDTPCVYFSTTGGNDTDPFVPGMALPLLSAYVVDTDKEATFVTDFRGQVVDTGNQCDIYPPVFRFR